MYTIYGHNQCSFCKNAINDLEAKGLPYTYKDVRASQEAMEEYLANANGLRTVPLILFSGEFVGGYDKLHTHIEMQEMSKETFDIDI